MTLTQPSIGAVIGPSRIPLTVVRNSTILCVRGFDFMTKWYEDRFLLRKTRKRLGLTQKNLGRLAGVSQNLISAIEDGRRSFVDPSRSRIWHALADVEIAQNKVKLAKEESNELREERRIALEKLEKSGSLGDPIVQEVIESLRREIATLEQRVEYSRMTSLTSLREYVGKK
jgi:transcriptional regulator with XRE-family HTH domain